MNFSRGTGGLNLSGPAADKLNRSGLFDGFGLIGRNPPMRVLIGSKSGD